MHLPLRWPAFGLSIISFGFKKRKKRRKEMTKTSGLVKRWRESFRAVSAQSRSAVNGSQTTSEKWTWWSICSIVAPSSSPPPPPTPSLMYQWMAWQRAESPDTRTDRQTDTHTRVEGAGMGEAGTTQFRECSKVYAPFSNWWRSCISLTDFLPFYRF